MTRAGCSLLTAAFIVLHQVDGRQILLNADYIISLNPTEEATTGKPNKALVHGAKCVVMMANGRYYGVLEKCDAVKGLMDATLPRLPAP